MFFMPDDDRPLRPATREDLLYTLSYGLRFNTVGKPHRHASELAASLAAELLVQHLERSGFVIMRAPPARDSSPGASRRPAGTE